MDLHNSSKKTAHKKAVFFNKLAEWIINAGGFAVIIAVFGILIFILIEGLPLLYGADITDQSKVNVKSDRILFTGVDEYQKYLFTIGSDHQIEIIDIKNQLKAESFVMEEINDYKIHALSSDLNYKNFALGLDSGKVALINLEFKVSFDENQNRIITPYYSFTNLIQIDSSGKSIKKISFTFDEDGNPTIVTFDGEKLLAYSSVEESSLFGEGEKIIYRTNLGKFIQNGISDFVLSYDSNELVIIDTKNKIHYLSLADKEAPIELNSITSAYKDSKITAISFITGNQSVVIGDDKGHIFSIMKSLDEKSESGWKIKISHTFDKMNSKVNYLSSSSRNKGFLVGAENGDINSYFLTSEKLLLSLNGNNIGVKEINFSPKSDGIVALYKDGSILSARMDNPHPEVSLKSLFGKILYEGYKDPEYVWQSTGGSDSFESKFSLVPLIVGTMKGTLYAMFFAIPLALLGALYTSTFAHPNLKNKIKPVVEILAALPSVVIGFLAGLWFAPYLESVFPGAVLMSFLIPIAIVLGVLVWRNLEIVQKVVPRGYEIFLIAPILFIAGWLSIELSGWFEHFAFAGDYRHWISESLNSNYDQRNSIVVGFALGFAVIPIIFTIAEDALSNVPQHLTTASLALGATKWQTAIRVVLPTASPGIFSAIMIGFGRAIGETMIVLMATGNTPIMDWGPFNGMRTLSANIAVEIPEAPYHGTLYRILFVSAALLFILTFIVNTVAEIVRQKLRKKYMHI